MRQLASVLVVGLLLTGCLTSSGRGTAAPAPSSAPSARPETCENAIGKATDTCVSTSASGGRFRLTLSLRDQWHADEVLVGTATLSFEGSGPRTISGSGGGLIAFAYTEVGGPRMVEPVSDAACREYTVDSGTSIGSELNKSGAISGDEPNFTFLRSFFSGPEVRLPAGTWDVTAIAAFAERMASASEGTEAACQGPRHLMGSTVRVTVGE